MGYDFATLFVSICLYAVIGRTFNRNDFFRWNIPRWLMYLLFIRDFRFESISVAVIIQQVALSLFNIMLILKLCKFDVFYYVTGLRIDYVGVFTWVLIPLLTLVMTYSAICDIIFKIKDNIGRKNINQRYKGIGFEKKKR